MSTPTPHQVVHQVIAAFDRGDWTIFDTHPGLAETSQHLPHMRAAFPDMRHTIGAEQATHQGPFMGIPPTGREVRFMLLWIERIVDGTVIQHWALPDFLSIFRQIGATIQPTHASASGSAQQS